MNSAADKPVRCYVAVGSNVDPRPNVLKAIKMLSEAAELTGVSTFRRTVSIGPDGLPDGQPEFINGVVRVLASCDARALKFDILRRIEADLGRRRGPDVARYAPRTIDLDLVIFGDRKIDEPDLRIPSADVQRPFIAAGLLELEPDLVLPGSGEVLSCLWPGRIDQAGAADTELTETLKELQRK